MVLCERFDTFFNRKCRNRDNYELLDRIRALQPFSLTNQRMRSDLRFDIQENYSHAVDHLQRTREYAVVSLFLSFLNFFPFAHRNFLLISIYFFQLSALSD